MITLLSLFLILLCSCSKSITADHIFSSGANFYTAINDTNIFYIHKDGIYQTDLDLKNKQKLLDIKNVNRIAATQEYLIYTQISPTQKTQYVYFTPQKVNIIDLDSTDVVASYEFTDLDELFIDGDRLYVIGDYKLPSNFIDLQGSPGSGLYIVDLSELNQPWYVHKTVLSTVYEYNDQRICMFEDENIIWYENYHGGTLSVTLYSKRYRQNASFFSWSQSSMSAMFSNSTGTIALNGDTLFRVNQKNAITLQKFPNNIYSDNPTLCTGYKILDNGQMILMNQRLDKNFHHSVSSSLKNHLWDQLFYLDKDFHLINTFTTSPKERILYADLDTVVTIKDNTLYSTSLNNQEKIKLAKIKLPNNSTVETCGKYLFFFGQGKLLETVELPQ